MKFTSTPKAPAAIGPYSQAVSVNGLLFTSEQLSRNRQSRFARTSVLYLRRTDLSLKTLLRQHASLQIWEILRHLTKFTESILQENPLVHVLR